MTADLLALADRVEKLTKPDRATDGAVWAAVQGVELLIFENPPSSGEVLSYRGALKYPDMAGVGRFTASLDAAMTLVPEGSRCGFEQAGINDQIQKDMAWCWPFESSWEPDWQRGDDSYKGHDKGVQCVGATPAIALTTACLRARASTDKGEV
jgi:hypothetical protein